MLGSVLRSWTNFSQDLSPSDWGILIAVSIMGLMGVLKLGVPSKGDRRSALAGLILV